MLAHWTTLHNSQLIENGILEIGDGYRAKNSELSTNGLPFARAGNIDNGFHFEEADILDDSSVRKAGSKISQPNDIVFTSKGTVGRFAFVKPETPRFVYSPQLCYWRIRKPSIIDPRFLFYWMHGRDFHHQVHQVKSLTTMADYVSLSDQRKMKIAAPPLTIQHTIAGILSAYDDLIENNARRIAILEEMARMLYDEWFVKFRFPGHEEVKMVESEMGIIPEGWEVTKLGMISTIIMGLSPSSQFYNERKEGLPFHQGVTDFEDYFPRDRIYCTKETRIAEPGDILFSVRAPVGRINIANKRIIIGRGLAAIRSNTNNQTFILWQLKKLFQREDIIGNGSIFKAVTKEDVHKINMLKPPPSIIVQFEKAVYPILPMIKVMTDKNTSLRRTRDMLLPKLISGEVDVSSWVGGDAEEAAQELAASVVGTANGYDAIGGTGRKVAEVGPMEPIEKAGLEWRSLWE